MRHRLDRFFISIISASLLTCVGVAVADDEWTFEDQDQPTFQFDQADYTQMAAELGIDPRSSYMQHLLTGKSYGPVTGPDGEELTPGKVIQHIRDKNGIAFPTKEEADPPFEISEAAIKAAEESSQEFEASTASYVEAQTKVEKLPRCKVAATERVPYGADLPSDPKGRVIDMLFIREGTMPKDPDEVFGQKTIVYEVSDKDLTDGTAAAKAFGVDCLPSRFRITGRFNFRDRGINALMNYDEDPYGNGRLHESIQNQP